MATLGTLTPGGAAEAEARNPPAEERYLAALEATRASWWSSSNFDTWKNLYVGEYPRGFLIIETLRKYLPGFDPASQRVLDVGCGDAGALIAFAESGATCAGVEYSQASVERGKIRAEDHGVEADLRQGVAEALPFPDSSFDLVLLDNVLEHVDNRELALREARRVLAPAGILYVVTPKPLAIYSLWRDPHYDLAGLVLMPRSLQKWYFERVRGGGEGAYGVGSIPTRRKLLHLLEGAGFTVAVPPRELWLNYLQQRIAAPERIRGGAKQRLARAIASRGWMFRNPAMRWAWDVALGSNFVIARAPGQRLRVLHAIYDDPANPWVGGGGSVRLREVYKRLRGRVAVTIATGNYPGAKSAEIDGIPYMRLGARKPYAWSRLTFSRKASTLLAHGSYDAAVFDFSAYSPVSIPQDRPVGIMLGQMVGSTAERRWGSVAGAAVARWERRQLRRARVVCTVSPSLAIEAKPWLAPGAEVHVVGAGVADQLFSTTRAEADYILFLGRFDVFQKGIDVLLDAMVLVRRAVPASRLRILGRGRDEARLRGMIEARELDDSVEVVTDPSFAEVRDSLSGALAVAVPSRFEGFGMVAAEAMAAGAPVVASDIPALREVVDPPNGGVLVPEGDVIALARELEHLVLHPEIRASFSISARRSAGRFRWDTVAEEHLAFLKAIEQSNPSVLRQS